MLFSLAFFFILGRCLDKEAQRVVNQFYPKDEQGIIIGNESVEITHPGNRKAIILFHGFLDSPRVYTKVLEKLETLSINTDIYAPLLPFHGRNLETAAKLNNREDNKIFHENGGGATHTTEAPREYTSREL